jgi:eukaryotic-like serine/threonine-protein kinase
MIRTTLFLVLLLFSSLLYCTIQHSLAQSDTNDSDSKNTDQGQGVAVKNNNGTFLTYQNPDFHIKMRYPSNWTKQEDNLAKHTIVGFSLIHQDIYDFTNTTLAELDVRVYNAPENETFTNLNIDQVNHIGKANTTNQVIIGHYKNATTTLAGLPALKIISYYFGDIDQKNMQVWTFIPSKHLLVELVYIADPSKYYLYLPIIQRMIDSVEIVH